MIEKITIKLAIVESRTFNNYELLKDEVDKLKEIYNVTEIITGGAKGADSLKDTKGLLGYISNICPICNSKIGNHYIYDDYFVEQMPFNFEDVEIKNKKVIPYDEVKRVLDLTFK